MASLLLFSILGFKIQNCSSSVCFALQTVSVEIRYRETEKSEMVIEELSSLLKACTANKSLSQGKLIHQKIISLGLRHNVFLSKSLINFYFACHSYDSGKLVFQTTTAADISLCNCLIAAYAKNSMFVDALDLFRNIAPLRPDFYTYPSVLKACGELRRIHDGETLHAQLVKTGLMSDVAISSSVVGVYAKCSMFDNASKLFDEMTERDVACWNTLISCYYQGGRAAEALGLFERMKKAAADSSGGYPQPNAVTFTIAISSCARILDLERGRAVHKEMESTGLRFDVFISSALVDMYGQCGDLDMAKAIFEQITRKNIVAWNAMISGFSLEGDSVSCLKMLERMKREGIEPSSTTLTSILTAAARSGQLQHGQLIHGYLIRRRNDKEEDDIIINCCLINLYFKCGRVKSAENVFRRTQQNTSVNLWNVMISGHVAVGNYCEAIGIYDEMKRAGTVKPDAVTFSSVLSACAQLASLEKGKEIHREIILADGGEENEIVMGSVVDMYAKCGAVDDAYYVFKKQVENKRSRRDVKLWTSMINAYGAQGRGREALELFWSMRQRNVEADKVAFLGVLSACSHAGLVDEGCLVFREMVGMMKPEGEHYACLIDLLGRAGRIEEAYKIIQAAEMRGEVEIELLTTLLSACCFHRDEELGDEIARAITKLDDNDDASSRSIINMYASVNRWDEVREVRWKMKELGLMKNHPGCSWIEINQQIHSFIVQDKSHPMAQTLYHSLSTLSSHMKIDHTNP